MYIKDIVRLDKRKTKIICDETTFPLYIGEIKKFDIHTDMMISDDLYKVIFDEILYKRAKERSLHLIEKMDRTEYQIRTKLKEGYYPDEVIERVIAFLNKYNYINDFDYARRYVEYFRKNKSSRLIFIDLAKKGINKDIISEIKLELDNDDNEMSQIFKILDKKKYYKVSDDLKEKKKIYNFLLRRGYDYESVNYAMKKYEDCRNDL